jgi:hypothetical protein
MDKVETSVKQLTEIVFENKEYNILETIIDIPESEVLNTLSEEHQLYVTEKLNYVDSLLDNNAELEKFSEVEDEISAYLIEKYQTFPVEALKMEVILLCGTDIFETNPVKRELTETEQNELEEFKKHLIKFKIL